MLDLRTGKLAGTIPTGDGETLFTAGQDDVVIVKPADRIVQRFDLATRKLQLTVHQAIERPLTLVALGYASTGPVLLGLGRGNSVRHRTESPVEFLDLKTLTPLDVQIPHLQSDCNRGTMIRPSASGTLFTLWRPNGLGGLATLALLGNHVVENYQREATAYARPNANGDTVFTPRGTFDARLNGKELRGPNDIRPIPAVEGPLFVGVPALIIARPNLPVRTAGSIRTPSPRVAVTIHAKSILTPLLTINGVEVRESANREDRLTSDQRVIYNPSENVLATLPETDDEVVLRRVDFMQELRASGKDYLAVVSLPPSRYLPGESLSYPIKTLSKRGDVSYRLQSGPRGMTLSKDGVLQWTPGKGSASGPMNVTILVLK